ncbi:MAG: lactate/malate family dehydrogenase [Hyphomicrobiales bacterium]
MTRIAILGASGSVGSALALHLLKSGLLEAQDSLLLVGHGESSLQHKLLSLRIDLLDAFDDERVAIELVADPKDVEADIIVLAAGETTSPDHPTRRDLAALNLPIFRSAAAACAERSPDALFVVVSNPVELAVHVLGEHVDPRRVIGMGAQQDSLRFARAIATDLGVSRHDVRATVLGEHGKAMVPLWDSVELLGRAHGQKQAFGDLRARAREASLDERVAELRNGVDLLLQNGAIAEAYHATRQALPDARIFVEPFITVQAMHSTPNATANATLQIIAARLAGDRRAVHGQVRLAGEIAGVTGVCGVPLTVSSEGWHLGPLDDLGTGGAEALIRSSGSINTFLAEILEAERVPAA